MNPLAAGNQVQQNGAPIARLESLDILRGFDMFMIVGFDKILRAFCRQVDHPVSNVLQVQFTHVEWEGFRFYDLIFPLFLFVIAKNRWTSTFVLFAGGWSFLLLALFYLIVDVWQFRRWGFFFKVIGANAIFAYMATALFWGQRSVFSSAAEVFLAGLKPYVGIWYETIVALGAFSVLWLILLHLYRRKIFLKI